MKSLCSLSTLCLLAGLLTGCLTTPVTIVPCTDPVEPGKYTPLASSVSGSSTQVDFLFLTFGGWGSPTRRAIDDAIGKTPGTDALVRVALEHDIFTLLFFTVYRVHVAGTPVKITAK